MNYAGKFDAALSLDGQGFHSPANSHVDSFSATGHGHVPDGAFVVPDPNLLFHGDFKRAGVDLVLSNDGQEFVVHDYFRGEKRAALASPDGAHLTGDLVNALAGHVQYAQAAGGVAAAQVIGHITKLSGSATAIRNGVSIILNNGDNVEKGDVLSTGSDSTLGVTFIDGTVFGLSSNARMVLNEMVYDPNGSSNSSLLSLVAGTISFVAGETAKHGDMKIDTPVATMGIRGTAVLTQISFTVPAGGGDPQPQANFQVLVEPDGTTGSYILFDKVTLLPIATVNQAGQMIQISGGNVSVTNALMSPDVQKLISDVFSLKFTDNTNNNTKLTNNFTDSITQDASQFLVKSANGAIAEVTFVKTVNVGDNAPPPSDRPPGTYSRVPGPPEARSLDLNGVPKLAFDLFERAETTGDTIDIDAVSGRVTFLDFNLGDRPTVKLIFVSYGYADADHHNVTASLSDLQKADIAETTAVKINIVADSTNANNGAVTWTYSIADNAFDFLAAGERLTLSYRIRVDNNFADNNETAYIDITVTVNGTNDQPVITSSVPTITFEGGTSVPGGPLTSDVPTSGTLTFTDVDLTDAHTVDVVLTSATLPGGNVPEAIRAIFANAMSVAIEADSTGTGSGVVDWSLADLPVYLADFIPKDEVVTLTYTVTITDSQGAISTQTITVAIKGTDSPAVVWIATTQSGSPPGGFWKDGANWETGLAPTIHDDVIVITDQLHGLTPSYPVTIDAAAFANSLLMNDYDTSPGHTAPEVINQSTLTIAGTLSLFADSKLTNFASAVITVGGAARFADTSTLGNAGRLTLAAGGEFGSHTHLTNSGVIELSGGTLTVLADIANAGGTLKADGGATLIVDTATIDGGTLAIDGTLELDGASVLKSGALDNSGTVEIKGTAALDSETVTNAATGTIEVLANGALTIDQGSAVANAGNVSVDANGKLTVNGATISGTGAVTNDGEIDLTGNAALSGGTLQNNSTFKVSSTGNALHGETVTNALTGTIEVLANGVLTIDQGSTVANTGNVTLDADGKLTVNGATISGAGTVTNDGEIDLTGSAALSGGTLNNNAVLNASGAGNALHGETVANAGAIEVLANGALAIDQGSTVDNSAGHLIVDANGSLTLSDVIISGGALQGAGAIDVTGASTINGGATLSVAAVAVDAALTLDGVTVSGSVLTANAGVALDGTVKLKDGAEIKGASAAARGAITNNGTLEIAGSAILLNDVLANTGHTVQVDDGQTLTLSGTEITGGTINNHSAAQGGTIDVTGNSTIDGNAALNGGVVTVEGGVTLTLDDVTASDVSITDNGVVKVNAGKKLTLSNAGVNGGALGVSGTLQSSGATTITDAAITNDGVMEAVGGLLTLVATTSAAIANSGTLRANGGELDIDGEAVTNTGTLAAIDNSTLKLIATTVTNTGGEVSVASGSTLDLVGATIAGGAVTISGTLESTGISAINDADIANTGTITVTGGTLTIDPAVQHTITNSFLIQADGGELDIVGDLIANTADIKAIGGGTLKLSNVTVANTGGTVTVDGTVSKLYLTASSINGGQLDNAGTVYGVSGSSTVTAEVFNTGTIEVQGGTLNLAGGLTGLGTLIIDDTATLELAGADAQTVTFAGGADALKLDNVAGQSFTGTIAGTASTGGTFTITGDADITTTKGDALDFTASGGTSFSRGDVALTPTGMLTGATNGIVVTQTGVGDISLTATGDIKGNNGHGIWLRDGLNGAGDITVNNVTGTATGVGADSVGVLAQNLNDANDGDISVTQLGGAVGDAYGIDALTQGNGDISIDAGGTITGGSTYGIRARSYGSGSQTITTEAGSTVTAGSSGIVAVNRTASLDEAADSSITVSAYGTINSGSSLNLSGNAPGGIEAGYTGATNGTSANSAVNGTVVVNNHADITAAAGHGINAYNYGNGDVAVNSFAGTSISVAGPQSIGINAAALSGGTGDVTIALGEDVTISGATSYGIRAYSIDQGDISVTLAKGDNITSGSSGIVAVNYATAIATGLDSTITVEAHGNIHSGTTPNGDGSTPGAIIAGYKPGGNGSFSNAVNGDVIVDSDAHITADAGYGIEAFTWGAGDITVTAGQNSQINAAGIAIAAFDHGGGDVSVTNEGSATGSVGLSVIANGGGDVTIGNDGDIAGTSRAGISVTQNEAGATGSTHITNTGATAGATGFAAIFVQGNVAGDVVIDNSGTIGPDDAASVTATTYAIVETGGAVTINNSGDINGNVSVATATFNNNQYGTWTVSGTSVFGNLSSIVNAGDIDLLNGASVSGTGLGITNSHQIDSWGTTSITGAITNTGTIEVNDGTLTLFGSLSGSGSVTLDANATLKLEGTVSQTITFAGDGAELKIDTSDFGGSIAGFAATDKIDLSSITYDIGTTATYDPHSGNLVVSDAYGHSITLNLVGNYTNAHFAGSDDGTGHTRITLNADDDALAVQAGETAQAASFSELADTTGASTSDPTPAATGTIHFTDVDLTDRPTADITTQVVTWIDSDGTTALTSTADQAAALKQALQLSQTGNTNNGSVGWSYSIADQALDFLGKDQTAKVVSTITLDDHQGSTTTAEVTVTITGTNDAPVIDGATLDTVAANDADPAGTAVAALFAGKFHDADDGASLKAVAVTADNASADQGVWQYEVAGSDQWVDITNVGEASALVLSPDTLIRFMPAAGFSGAPGTLDVHALDDTYTGDATTTATPVSIDVSGAGHGGITPVSDQAASIGTEVLAPTGPALTLDGLDVDGNAVENSAVTVTINDPDAPTGSGIVYNFEVYDVNTSSWTSVQASGGNSYTPSESDEGQQLRVEVSYTDLHGHPEDLTASAGTVQDDPNETAHVELAGLDDNNNAVDGTPVVATVTDNDAPGSGITYIFQTFDVQTSSWSIVQQGSGNSYTPSESDDGKSLRVDVSFTDTNGNFETGEAWAGTVQPHPPLNTNVWTGEAGGQEWNTGGNWSLGHVPTATEAVVVDTDGAVDLALDDDGYTIGPLSLGATTALDVNGTGWDSQTEQVNSYLLVDGELSNSGVIDVQNASLDAFHHVANAGTIDADGDNATVNFGNLSGDTIDNAGGYVQANDGGRVNFLYNTINGGEIDAYGEDSVVLMHQSIVNGVTLNGADGGHFKVAGTTTFNSVNGPMSIGADIHIEVGGTLVLDGAVNDAGEVLNQGALVVETGAAQLLGDLAGPGSVQIIDAASLELGGISESAIGFVGNGTGTLRLDAASHFTGTVTGFSYGDAIDIAGVAPGVVGLVSAGGELQVHYGQGDGAYFTITGNYDEAGFAKTDDGNGGTELVWTHQSPVIDTTHFVHTHNPDNTDTLTDLSVAGSSNETYSFTAVTEQASAGSSVTPDSGDDLSLTQLNADLAGGVTYDQGSGSFTNDKITFTVTDGFGANDAVNFIFNQGGQGPVVLNGTSGKDVIFGAEHSDTLISGGGQDQFVFTPVDSSPDAVLHTVYGFDTTLDKIDLRQFDGISSFGDLTITQESADTLVTLDSHESVLLKNVLAGNLHANGFIITSHGA